MTCNILEDSGKAYAEEYLSQFSSEERRRISDVYRYVKKFGTKFVIQEITKGLTFSDEDYVPVQEEEHA